MIVWTTTPSKVKNALQNITVLSSMKDNIEL